MTLVGFKLPNRTECPPTAILTVEQLLQLPCVLVGSPQVIADAASLKRHIGWAHVLENLNPGSYLRGQELVLTTGIGWALDANFEQFTAELAELHAAGLVLELGAPCPSVPPSLVQACRKRGLPLIVLHEPVAFVEITETLHQMLFSSQTRQIEAGGEVTEHFTQLMQQGAPAETILLDCARMLGEPVVLEDTGYNLLRYASAVKLPSNFFDQWQDRSRVMHRAGNIERQAIPVRIHGKDFGSLIAPKTAAHPAGPLHVLTMAAIALGAELLRKRRAQLWKFDTACELLDDLLNHREADTNLLHGKFDAAGFPMRNKALRGFAINLAPPIEPREAARAIEKAAGSKASVVIGALHSPKPKLFGILSINDSDTDKVLAKNLQRITQSDLFIGPLYLGEIVSGLASAQFTISQAIDGCELGLEAEKTIVHAGTYPLALLTHELRDEPAMQRLPQHAFAAILTLDDKHRSEHLRVLEAYLSSPTNRSQAATRCHLSRTVFYQRLAALETILGMDLNDAKTLTLLTLALTVYRQSQM